MLEQNLKCALLVKNNSLVHPLDEVKGPCSGAEPSAARAGSAGGASQCAVVQSEALIWPSGCICSCISNFCG